jgi:ADP-dependent NAD(P)H-hydrate dehydratase / NAD(P)H-hydrate epimerase
MKVLTAPQMQAADKHAIEVLKIPSLVLMENAATQVSRILQERYPEPRTTVVVCGKGNNGGDGIAVARLLRLSGWTTTIVLFESQTALKNDPAENWTRAVHAGVRCLDEVAIADLPALLQEADLIIDALFGTGLTKPLEGNYAQAVEAINTSGKDIWSIDVPSGLSSESGELIGPAIHATGTVALAALKYCHILPPASELCGLIYAVDIGIPTASTVSITRGSDVLQLLPFRKPDSHKGTYGHVMVVAGSTGKSGAAFMSAKSALRAGAGLVTVYSPRNVQNVIAALGPEIMTQSSNGNPDFFSVDAFNSAMDFAKDKSVVALGPGIGTNEQTWEFVRDFVEKCDVPMVIDADGLNLVALDRGILLKRKAGSTILTPHPGEMARLLYVDNKKVQSDRIEAALKLARETGSIVVLKGYRTIIADPEENIWINPTGGQPLATGGTGDILTGVIAGFIAQKIPLLQAAIAGVYIHGFTANLFEHDYPQQALNAMDIPAMWNHAVNLIRTQKNFESEYLNFYFTF